MAELAAGTPAYTATCSSNSAMSSAVAPVVAGGTEVQLELLLVAQPGQQRERDDRAGAAVEMRPRPDAAPGAFGDEALEIAVQRGDARNRAVDMRVAEHLPPGAHAIGVAVRGEEAQQGAGDGGGLLGGRHVGRPVDDLEPGAGDGVAQFLGRDDGRGRVLGADQHQGRHAEPGALFVQVGGADRLAAAGIAPPGPSPAPWRARSPSHAPALTPSAISPRRSRRSPPCRPPARPRRARARDRPVEWPAPCRSAPTRRPDPAPKRRAAVR